MAGPQVAPCIGCMDSTGETFTLQSCVTVRDIGIQKE